MSLVNTKEMFEKAYEGGYAIGAFNVNNMEIIQGIVGAAEELKSPLILQASASAIKYADINYLVAMVETAAKTSGLPIALHLDHGPDLETCKMCIDAGFSSVMIDGSHLDFEENIALTKSVVDYARSQDRYITVEAELGRLAGVEDEIQVDEDDAMYTNPDEVVEFVERTGVDSLAIAIGTSHGAYKFKPGTTPRLRFDILEEIEEKLPGFPIVLHGASSVMQDYVKIITDNGGEMEDAIGIPEDLLRKANSMAVCKVNMDTDLRVGMTAGIRKHFNEHPDHFDPRQYLGEGREYIKDIVTHKITKVLGSEGKA